MTGPGFADINFGYSAAETEGLAAPELLLDGFLDYAQLTSKALKGMLFLFLGYKGSGKTAIAERAVLLAKDDPLLFVHHAWLGTFSFTDFKTAAGGGSEAQAQYPIVWSWLLLLTLLQSLERDEAGRHDSREYARVVNGIRALNLLPVPSLADLVTTSSRKTFRLTFPRFFEYTREIVAAPADLQLRQVAASLERGIQTFETESRHVIFLDGLDSILTQRELQFQSLAALMHEAARLNDVFRRSGQRFKFVILCRTDIFDNLSDPNLNKLRQDRSAALEWFNAPSDPDQTRLIRFANLRASLTLRREVRIFDEFLPPKIAARPIRKVILDRTRHTPRDLIQILRSLQSFAPPEGPLGVDQVLGGLRSYSMEYFIPEMRNELAGYLEQPQIEQAISLLSTLTHQRFTLRELEAHATELGFDGLDLEVLTRVLYEASCIGTYQERERRGPLYTIKYRNRTTTLLPSQEMWLHPATLPGLNIAPGRPPEHGRPNRR